MSEVLLAIESYSSKYKRTDIVFDVYRSSSLKAEIRSKRRYGVRRRVTGSGKIPSSWRNFLPDNDNKTVLFMFLADKIAQMSTTTAVIVTKEEHAVCTHSINLSEIMPCIHEEADTRIVLHARHAAKEGSKVIMIKTNDTDVLVIAISVPLLLQQIGIVQL